MKLLIALFVVASVVAVSEANFLCPYCQQIVGYLETEFNQNAGHIEKDEDKICDTLFHNNQVIDPICHQIVDNSIDDIENFLKNGQTAPVICKEIHLC